MNLVFSTTIPFLGSSLPITLEHFENTCEVANKPHTYHSLKVDNNYGLLFLNDPWFHDNSLIEAFKSSLFTFFNCNFYTTMYDFIINGM